MLTWAFGSNLHLDATTRTNIHRCKCNRLSHLYRLCISTGEDKSTEMGTRVLLSYDKIKFTPLINYNLIK